MNTVSCPTLIQNLIQSFKTSCLIASSLTLTACYVVPVNQYPQAHNAPASPQIVAPSPVVLIAKLYPNNDAAAPFGVLSGSVTNHLNGRGEITVVQGGEVFRGEATRNVNDARSGTANGAGNQGGYMSCAYTMNNATLGTGNCRFNNGAVYRFHLGQ